MFSVFINEREKKQLKVPQSPWLFYYPHPTKKKSTRKRAEEDTRNQEWSQVRWGRLPLCSMFLGSERGKGSFLPEKERKEMGGGKGK